MLLLYYFNNWAQLQFVNYFLKFLCEVEQLHELQAKLLSNYEAQNNIEEYLIARTIKKLFYLVSYLHILKAAI